MRDGMATAMIGLAATLLTVAACSAPERTQQPEGPPPTRAEIEGYLNARLHKLSVAYPEARVADLQFSADNVAICGKIVSPGERPLAFHSTDLTPETLHRSIGIPPLLDPGDWRHERVRERQEIALRNCERLGVPVDLNESEADRVLERTDGYAASANSGAG